MERTEIDAVRRMPLADFLARLGYEPVRRSGNELWYIAPYRGERTPSFRVNVAKQLWYDFGLGKGGDIFTLAGEFLQSDDFRTQAKFIAETANMTVTGWKKPAYFPKPIEPVFEDVEVIPLLRSPLTDYLAERGIPIVIAFRRCCRLNYGVRGKRYFAVGFPNMAGGYEVRSRYFKGCIPPKSISLVKANDIPADECLVFEGFTDFLSAVTLGVTGNADCLVLNSIANVEKAAGLLEGYGRIGCFLDRDEAGRRTLDALTKRYGERVTDRSSLYDDCKDLNEYLQQTMKKQKNNHLKIEEQ
ncbi:toprim domain-containing protein [Phocaeicola vulgatus]|uniref:toprim domain-containing protein n=1 Tax=Phocaeicola vulgatus TaxID=821 RepID=UPI0034A30A5E